MAVCLTYQPNVRVYSIANEIINYDYPFSTPTKNAVNKRIIERPII